MRYLFAILIVLAVSYGCAGSAFRTHWQADANNTSMAKLKPGMTEDEVRQIMGPPDRTEAYTIQKEPWLFLLYITEGRNTFNRQWGDSNYTPVGIRNGKLYGWGRNFYQEKMKDRDQVDLNLTHQAPLVTKPRP